MDDTISRQAAIDALGEEPEVWTENDEYAYVLIPNYGRYKSGMVLLMQDYACPQIVGKKGWVESGRRSNIIVKMITEAASLIAQEDEPCQ